MSGEPINGVGILRVPKDISTAEMDSLLRDVPLICQGTVMILPSTRDIFGNYVYDFRIEGGDFSQVQVRHEDVDRPQIVEAIEELKAENP